MKTIELKVLDSKVMDILKGLEKLNLVAFLNKDTKQADTQKNDDFFEATGMWKDEDIDANQLRKDTWKR